MRTYLIIISFLKKLIAFIILFLTPVFPYILISYISIVTDTFSGVLVSIKQKNFSFKIFCRLFVKLLSYGAIIVFFYYLDTYILGGLLSLIITDPAPLIITKLVTLVLVYFEAVSINKNVETLTKINVFQKVKEVLVKTLKLKDSITKLRE